MAITIYAIGYFLVGDELKVNAHAWNQVANMWVWVAAALLMTDRSTT